MTKQRVTVRLEKEQLARAKKALAATTAKEAIERALPLVSEKVVHDSVIRRYSGLGGRKAFACR